MPIDLSAPGQKQALTAKIKAAIDTYCMTYDNGPREHLGASVIGHECNFYIWGNFRWLAHKPADPRMQRLFRRGHLEELRFVEYLRGIGFQVWTHDENGKQFRVAAVGGHYGGSCDGVTQVASDYDLSQPLLCEFKTKGTGTAFTKLKERGMRLEAPQHFAQASCYGYRLGIKHVLYMVANKNDDELHIEIEELDWKLAAEMEKRAEYIITAKEPPSKVSLQPTYYQCKTCDLKAVCHERATPDKNCRSCIMASPADNGEWYCGQYGQNIPADVIRKGCDSWQAIV